jgi:CoA:oxalate CoA-transferase
VPAAVVNTLDRSLTDPHVLHRKMVLEMEGPDGERLRVAGNPIKFRGEDEPPYRYPPHLGADTGAVLADVLGLSPDRIAALARDGVIGTGRQSPKQQTTASAAAGAASR